MLAGYSAKLAGHNASFNLIRNEQISASLKSERIYLASAFDLEECQINSLRTQVFQTSIFPNPASSMLTITSENEISEITIYSIEGKIELEVFILLTRWVLFVILKNLFFL
ncbi:MAG: hypothetical protein ACI9GZ_004278 [Bacteroidia bacterium]